MKLKLLHNKNNNVEVSQYLGSFFNEQQ